MNNLHTKYTFVNVAKCVTTVLDYYLKQKSALGINYGAISSTDMSYHKCSIIVLTQN